MMLPVSSSRIFSNMAVVAWLLLSRSAPLGLAFSNLRRNHRYSYSYSYNRISNCNCNCNLKREIVARPVSSSSSLSLSSSPYREQIPIIRAKASPSASPSPSPSARARKSLANLVAASRSGLDPSLNRFHAPYVYHDGYSSVPDWPPNHTFPMNKFERIAHALLTTTSKTVPASNLPRPLVRSGDDFYRPPDFGGVPIEEWLDLLNSSNSSSSSSSSSNSNSNSNRNSNSSDDDDDNYSNNNEERNNEANHNSLLFGHRFLKNRLTREEARTIGFREQTHRPELVERTVLEVAGTVLTAQLALKHGIAANLAGGTHHAHPEGGAGYTILNDLAIATDLLTKAYASSSWNDCGDDDDDDDDDDGNDSTAAAAAGSNIDSQGNNTSGVVVDRVLVIDCDVHQGDGTAQYSTLWDQYDDRRDRLFTLSIHCESNYPFQKHNSTYDVGLPDRCNDRDYLAALEKSVGNAIAEVDPHLVLYDAGVDVYRHDKLGRLDLSEEGGIRRRDRWVLDRCVSLGIPVAAVVGGGYDKDSIDALGRRHAILHEECAYVWRKHKMWLR